MSKKLIQSYVLDKYFISTIHRQSSALVDEPYNWYYETIVWEWDAVAKKRGSLVAEYASRTVEQALENHFNICKQIREYVIFKDIIDNG